MLLGPRQTGKTTLLTRFRADLHVQLIQPNIRQRYEREPSLLDGEVRALTAGSRRPRPLVIVDEIQKVPLLLDVVQALIDDRIAQFILTGSSARKLRRSGALNLLPGRVVSLRLDPLSYAEHPQSDLETLLVYGSLPAIVQTATAADREIDLQSYMETYLEEEVRSEALVRNIGTFMRFLEYAGLESGNIVNYHKLAQELGINHTTIAAYYEVLADCLIAERIDPLTRSVTRKKLTKSSRYVLFDLGVRRCCAQEGPKVGKARLGSLFEQYVGLELIRAARQTGTSAQIRFWRDPDGPEVDWVIERQRQLIPLEVKWTDTPRAQDIRHLQTFLSEYPEATTGYVVCRSPHPVQLTPQIRAIPWQDVGRLLIERFPPAAHRQRHRRHVTPT
ncbi:MAG: ATP-binding protein [Deltaproteobacteria bacterium]|nr:ATP-binding protein [Deltaproteobacteria bacterium]